MAEFREFIENLLSSLGVPIDSTKKLAEHELAGVFLSKLNKFMYHEYEADEEWYISRFHKFWEEHHDEVLGVTVDEVQCSKVAYALEPIYAQPDRFLQYQIKPPIERAGISDRAVANVRFFTTIQDFKINIHKGGRNPYERYKRHPEWFTAKEIVERSDKIIDEFLRYLEATGSQGDKRRKWMLAAAEYLVEEHEGDAYNILQDNKGDASAIRKELAAPGYLGYSYKKADVFLRDMADWEIWKYSKNADQVNVASDANTMRIALRTGVIRTRFPLLASYLDVYCYQYGLVDREASLAWRKVWESWASIPNNHRPPTPASMDYLLYKSIGKQVCRPTPKCEYCVFNEICPKDTRKLNPPKSISQKGMTGWDSGATNSGGGGGIMS